MLNNNNKASPRKINSNIELKNLHQTMYYLDIYVINIFLKRRARYISIQWNIIQP